MLVLYTDGVTEGRRGAEFFGEERLRRRRSVEHAGTPLPAEGILADVLEFQDGSARDDIAVVAVRVPAPDPTDRPTATAHDRTESPCERLPRRHRRRARPTSSTSPHLVTAYYTGRAGPLRPRPARRVRHLRPPGQQPRTPPSTRRTSSRPRRRSATTAAQQGYDGPLFVGRDTHGLSEPAWASALEVLAANDVTVLVDDRDGYTPTPAVSHAILRANLRQDVAASPTASW